MSWSPLVPVLEKYRYVLSSVVDQRRAEAAAGEVRAASVRKTAEVLRSLPCRRRCAAVRVDVAHGRHHPECTAGRAIRDEVQPPPPSGVGQNSCGGVDGRTEVGSVPWGRSTFGRPATQMSFGCPARRPAERRCTVPCRWALDRATIGNGCVHLGHGRGPAPRTVITRRWRKPAGSPATTRRSRRRWTSGARPSGAWPVARLP